PLAAAAKLFEELLAEDMVAGKVTLPLADAGGRVAHLHGHCHQKSFGAMGATERLLAAVPGLKLQRIESSCCGMAGAFGHQAETFEVSQAMGELSLLPAVRAAGPEDVILADGTSCRKQIEDGSGRSALHVARFIDAALES